VALCAGVGIEIGQSQHGHGHVLGPLDGLGVGVLIGSAAGYVIGGIIGRRTLATVDATTSRLRDVSAETLVAGCVGAITGAVVAAAMGWPLLLIRIPFAGFSLFSFVLVVCGLCGARLASARRHSVVGLVGSRYGVTPRVVPAAARERVIDASTAIDGRILDIIRAGWLAGPILVPAPVLSALESDGGPQARHALEILERLRREPEVDIEVLDVPADPAGAAGLPGLLVRLCLERGSTLLTAERSLSKAARLAGVAVMDLPALTDAVRPTVTVGDDLSVQLVRAGKAPGQAVGFLDDGTMVVAERARSRIGSDVTVQVTSVMTGDKGRMVFGELVEAPEPVAAGKPGPSPATFAHR
jgi:uncharacterized protein YacL